MCFSLARVPRGPDLCAAAAAAFQASTVKDELMDSSIRAAAGVTIDSTVDHMRLHGTQTRAMDPAVVS